MSPRAPANAPLWPALAFALLLSLSGGGCTPASHHISTPPLAPGTDRVPPAQARALYLRGQMLLEQEAWTEARLAFERALRIDPGSPAILRALADTAAALGDATAAEQYRQQALASSSSAPAPAEDAP